MNNKTMAIVAYLTIIGWVVAYLSYKKSSEKSSLVKYHLGQALGVFLVSLVLSILSAIVLSIIPSLGIVSYIISLISLALMLLGAITASNEVERPVPLVGGMFEGKFNF
ncbi:MAG TPA: hypothetical protein VN040_23195 [Pseudosphingobacterium sp.]|jgi:uncharacterized membrane protein|nr:hypothetical protein [Pseudosphingobacterium sp.]